MNPMYNKYTTEELLVEGRALIAQGWCQKVSARDAKGRETPFGGKEAVSFCMSGALCHLMNPMLEPWKNAVAALREIVGYAIAPWNDHHERTQAEVLEAFDKALAIVRGSGKVEA